MSIHIQFNLLLIKTIMNYNHHQFVEKWLSRIRKCLSLCYTDDSQMITMELHKGNV